MNRDHFSASNCASGNVAKASSRDVVDLGARSKTKPGKRKHTECREDRGRTSIFLKCKKEMPFRIGCVDLFCAKVGSSPCSCTDRFLAIGLTCVGFLNRLHPIDSGKVRLHGAFSTHEALRPNDQSCHHEAWLHLDFVEWHDVQHQREKRCPRILLKERSSPYRYGKKSGRISESMSDHSPSS